MHTTNYINTFITVAEDCPVDSATAPPSRKTPSVSERTYLMLKDAPYRYTSDDVLFGVFADRKDIPKSARTDERTQFFAKAQACMRASDLGKKYGWGLHHDHEGKVAMVAMESDAYQHFASGDAVCPKTKAPVVVKAAMRSKRKT